MVIQQDAHNLTCD